MLADVFLFSKSLLHKVTKKLLVFKKLFIYSQHSVTKGFFFCELFVLSAFFHQLNALLVELGNPGYGL
jgi:hypothetical protein